VSERKPTLVKIADFALARGVRSIKDLPGCWHYKVDEQWEMWLNGHREPVTLGHGPEVPPFSAYIEFNGWPAGVTDAAGGWFAAGSIANLDAFERALDSAEMPA
jgi:hypothetical protein